MDDDGSPHIVLFPVTVVLSTFIFDRDSTRVTTILLDEVESPVIHSSVSSLEN